MSQVLDKVRESIEEHCLLPQRELVVVGVSGGPDSLCLLHVLCRLIPEYRLTLHVAHLNHGLRGVEADSDAEFVQTLGADWGLPWTVENADVHGLAQEHRLAIEEAARRARYAFLSRTAEAVCARTIAVGHNADDQTETVLMHWLRGSGLAGLRGMLHLSPLDEYRLLEVSDENRSSRDLRLIRPLLEVTRAEVEAYCEYYGLQPRFDRSNLDTTLFRNWLRHEVLPLLASHNPNIHEVIRRSARVIAADYVLLRSVLGDTWPRVTMEETTKGIAFELGTWRALPTSLQRSTLREAIHRLRRSLRDINFLHVEQALRVALDGTTGDEATLPHGLILVVGYDRLRITDAGSIYSPPDWPLLPERTPLLCMQVPGVTPLPESGWVLEARLLEPGDLPNAWADNADPWRAFLDAEAVGRRLWLRTRQPGDRFQPLGMKGHSVNMADFFTNQKVPHSARDRLPLVMGKAGIAWVCGQRIDERTRVHAGSTRVLLLQFRLE